MALVVEVAWPNLHQWWSTFVKYSRARLNFILIVPRIKISGTFSVRSCKVRTEVVFPWHFTCYRRMWRSSTPQLGLIPFQTLHLLSSTGWPLIIVRKFRTRTFSILMEYSIALGDQPNSKSNGKAAGHNTDGFDCSTQDLTIQNRYLTFPHIPI